MNKFENLTKYLKDKNEDNIKLSFSDLEKIIGFPLPGSAYKHRAYFANVLNHSISKAWMEAGYRSTNINIYNKTIEFIKECCFQKTLLSSYVFVNAHDYKELLRGNVYLSGVAFCESIFLFGLNYDTAYKRLLEYNIHLVDDELRPIDITSPYASLNNAKTHCLNIYNSFIKITLFKCLITLFSNHNDRQRIFDSFVENYSIVFDFPYSIKTDVSLKIFDIKLRAIISKVGLDKTFDQIVDMIGTLDYKNVDKSVLSNLSFVADNYLSDVCASFIQSCKTKEPFICVDYVSELLNIQILSKHNDLIYLTSNSLNNRILIGKILEQITLIESRGGNDENCF